MTLPILLIHGGAGAIERAAMTPELEADFRAALSAVLRAGETLLADGASSLDVVEHAVALLEDNPLFNAGRGAVFNAAGRHELEAAVMDGATRKAGGVLGVRCVRNPVRLARRVMERSPHVLLAGDNAESFARLQNLELVGQEYFSTERRRQQLQRDQQSPGGIHLSLSEDMVAAPTSSENPFGTVGAVALDRAGNLAAATSTGGMSNKWPGRVGDSAIVGAGCYADNATCAVSGTGQGEHFLRNVIAHDVAARMAYLGESPEQAATQVIREKLSASGGRGGVIVLDRQGRFAMPFNSAGMYRGLVQAGGMPEVAIYAD